MKILVNVITLYRLLASFLVLYCVLSGFWFPAFFFVLTGLLSDLVDGPLSRKAHVATSAGKVFDLTADILLDEFTMLALYLVGKIGFPVELVIAIAIVLIRLPAILPPSSGWYLFAVGSLPIYSLGMIWLITNEYARNALGVTMMVRIIELSVPICAIIIFLKRERIASDLRKGKQSIFG